MAGSLGFARSGGKVDQETLMILYALAFFGGILLALLLTVCCYCLRDKGAHQEAKVYYYRNIQEEGD